MTCMNIYQIAANADNYAGDTKWTTQIIRLHGATYNFTLISRIYLQICTFIKKNIRLMDGRMDGNTDRWMDEWINERLNDKIDG